MVENIAAVTFRLSSSSKKVGSVFLCMELFPLKVCELDQIYFAY